MSLPTHSRHRAIAPHHTSVAAFVGHFPSGPENDPIRVRSLADVERHFGGLHPSFEAPAALQQFFANGGTVAFVVRTRPGADNLVGSIAMRTGIHALLDLDPYAFNLLCIPDAAGLDLTAQHHLYSAAARLCERQRAFLICDMPARCVTTPDALAWMRSDANPRSPNGAVYFPRMRVSDSKSGSTRTVAPSGTVAGVMARLDAERGIWKTPAGTDASIRGATPSVRLADVDSRALNPRAVNAIRTLPAAGTVIWGARTLRGDASFTEEFKYVAIRRLVLHVEQSIHRGLSWVAFESNGESLWATVRAHVEEFLDRLFRLGAFQGAKADEAYFVRCDRTTMTQSDIDEGRLIVLIGIAPTKPAEFVIFRIFAQSADGRG